MRLARLLLPTVVLLSAAGTCDENIDEPQGPTDSIPPVITALEPTPGAQNVGVAAVVTVRFSEPINPATVGSASFLLRRGSDTVPGTYAFGDSSASYVPAANLPSNTLFSVIVSRGIRDPAGNQLAADTAWGFRTVGAGTPAPPAHR